MKWLLISFFVVLCVFSACQKKGSPYSIIPHIDFTAMSPDSGVIHAGTGEDSLIIRFHFTDGDADLGNNADSTNKDIYMIDTRDTTKIFSSFNFPDIDQSVEDPDKGLSGDCIFSLSSAFILPRQDSVHIKADTLQYIIYIKDRAGHESNRITTPHIYLRP